MEFESMDQVSRQMVVLQGSHHDTGSVREDTTTAATLAYEHQTGFCTTPASGLFRAVVKTQSVAAKVAYMKTAIMMNSAFFCALPRGLCRVGYTLIAQQASPRHCSCEGLQQRRLKFAGGVHGRLQVYG
ncbi:MAG: hypothetical protein AAF541_00595 [Pseudomonadota bacterium]